MGPGTIGVEVQSPSVVVDRLAEVSRTGPDFAKVDMRGGQPGIVPQGVLERQPRLLPFAPAFPGHAEVVEAGSEVGSVPHQLMKGGNGPGPPSVTLIVPQPVLVNQDEGEIVLNGERVRADFQSPLVIGQCRCGITPRAPSRAVQRQGQRKVGPEVFGIVLLDAPEKADTVLTGRGQPFAQRQQQRYGLLRQRRRLRSSARAFPSLQAAGSRTRSRQGSGSARRATPSSQSCRAGSAAQTAQSSSAATMWATNLEARTRAATPSGSSGGSPSPWSGKPRRSPDPPGPC